MTAKESVNAELLNGWMTEQRLARAKELQEAGWLHITGLPFRDFSRDVFVDAKPVFEAQALARHALPTDVDPDTKLVIGKTRGIVQAHQAHLARYYGNNGKVILYTNDGEVWIATPAALRVGLQGKYAMCLPCYVYCSNGEELAMHHMLERMADPYSTCNGRYSPIPSISAE